jgi:hypothetical protein
MLTRRQPGCTTLTVTLASDGSEPRSTTTNPLPTQLQKHKVSQAMYANSSLASAAVADAGAAAAEAELGRRLRSRQHKVALRICGRTCGCFKVCLSPPLASVPQQRRSRLQQHGRSALRQARVHRPCEEACRDCSRTAEAAPSPPGQGLKRPPRLKQPQQLKHPLQLQRLQQLVLKEATMTAASLPRSRASALRRRSIAPIA